MASNVKPTSATDPEELSKALAEAQQRANSADVKALTLQCIIEAKDREMQLIRQSVETDVRAGVAAELEQLSQENARLRKRLLAKEADAARPLAQKAASPLGRGGQDALPAGGPSAPDDAGGVYTQLLLVLQQGLEALTSLQARLAPAAAAASACDVVVLNVAGTELVVQRATLLQVRSSRLAHMFAPDSPDAPPELAPRDGCRRYFLPYDPEGFSRVLSALQARHALGTAPSTSGFREGLGLQQEVALRRLLKHLGLLELFYDGSGINNGSTSSGGAGAVIAVPLGGGGGAPAAGASDSGGSAAGSTHGSSSHVAWDAVPVAGGAGPDCGAGSTQGVLAAASADSAALPIARAKSTSSLASSSACVSPAPPQPTQPNPNPLHSRRGGSHPAASSTSTTPSPAPAAARRPSPPVPAPGAPPPPAAASPAPSGASNVGPAAVAAVLSALRSRDPPPSKHGSTPPALDASSATAAALQGLRRAHGAGSGAQEARAGGGSGGGGGSTDDA